MIGDSLFKDRGEVSWVALFSLERFALTACTRFWVYISLRFCSFDLLFLFTTRYVTNL
jgi:hypothetical protein